ncbi:MAG: PAS domain-containing sensor histidine kinase [Clostridium celatum]|uniref:PAS domain-containing sensor histidine kinase n=1 Tax=Clostridium sp. TaxID=1506 RepID=UPI0025C220E5|nr:PAS domain-containing sensor histidine kinase [Clostridium sp.]MBS4955770.1 PAS domain-containing protein [Clostridium sp.]MDU2122948.1 PAS domain-containing sensor histidine kinase [Clostridium celatum]MDU4980538.1 PAS domain-containing sensor histidine kinase [Clostridium celatum]
MIDYKEVLKKMPMAMIYGKFRFLENENFKMEIKYINDKMLLLLNLAYDEVIFKDFFDVLSEYKEDINFLNMVQAPDDKNLTYTKYIKQLMDFIKVTIQKVNDEYFILYFESCMDKSFLEGIQRKDRIFFIKNSENKYVDCSEKFKILSDYIDKDIYGRNDIEIYGEEIGEKYWKSYQDFIKSGKPYCREICKLKNNIYLLHKYSIYSNNEIIGVIGIFEKMIGKMEKINDGNTLAYITNNMTEYVVLRDTEGVYLDCNNSFLEWLNIDRKEIIGKKITTISKLGDIAKDTILSDLEVINNRSRKIYNEYVKINGKIMELEIVKEPFLDSYGNLVGVIDIIRDISHKSEVEKLRLEFFANLSHELRTPLNLIFSSLQTIELIEKDLLKKNNRLKNYIDIINQNSKRLLKLVNNLIDSTKFDCGYYEYNPQNYNIVHFIENIAMSVAEFAKQNDINLIFDTDVEEKIMAFDLEKLERTMFNLLSNSIKYTNSSGKIEVLLKDCGETFNITVKDNGIGIPDDKLKVIFERFKQVEDRLRKRSEGSGIGLSIVKDLINIQGGIIDVKSEFGVGSEFTVKLPVSILSNEDHLNKLDYNEVFNGMITRMNIEFSDIYI